MAATPYQPTPYLGWSGLVTRLELDEKQYSIYQLRHDDGTLRVLNNWGKKWADGQWRLDPLNEVTSKTQEKLTKGYNYVKRREPIQVTGTLLLQAGVVTSVPVTANSIFPLPGLTDTRTNVWTPSGGTATLAADLDRLTEMVALGMTPAVLIGFNEVRTRIGDLRRELGSAEAQLSMLQAMIEARSGGAQ